MFSSGACLSGGWWYHWLCQLLLWTSRLKLSLLRMPWSYTVRLISQGCPGAIYRLNVRGEEGLPDMRIIASKATVSAFPANRA
jgi:hypothetical protein